MRGWQAVVGLLVAMLWMSPPAAAVAVLPSQAPVVAEVAPGQAEAQAMRLPYLLAVRTTNFYHASPSQAENIALVARRLNGVVVQPGQVFSYYRVVGPYTAENGYGWGRAFVGDRIVPSIGGGVCQGASTLYAAVLLTGMKVVERHPHGLMVPYLPPGEDATVSSDYLNFRFQNTFSTPVLIAAKTEGRHLTVALWGGQKGPQITVKHEILERYPFRTIVKVNPQLKPGEERVLAPGQEGVKAKTWLEIQTPEGTVIKSLGIDRYRPSPRIIERGPSS